MGDSRKSKDVLCPFYVRDECSVLTCEGFPDSCVHKQVYQNKAALLKQMEIFCCSWRHTRCETYRLIMNSKYHDDEEPG